MHFGDEVQTHTHHTHDHTPNTTPHHQPHTRSQHKRSLRSRDARQRRAQQRIHNRATHRRNYRSWRSALTPTPYTALSQGTGSLGQPHQQKPVYDLTGRTPSHRRLQQQRSRQKQQHTTTPPLPATANNTHRCHRFRRFLHVLKKMRDSACLSWESYRVASCASKHAMEKQNTHDDTEKKRCHM